MKTKKQNRKQTKDKHSKPNVSAAKQKSKISVRIINPNGTSFTLLNERTGVTKTYSHDIMFKAIHTKRNQKSPKLGGKIISDGMLHEWMESLLDAGVISPLPDSVIAEWKTSNSI